MELPFSLCDFSQAHTTAIVHGHLQQLKCRSPSGSSQQDINFLTNSSLPKTLQGEMSSFHNVKIWMVVACRGQIYSEPEPSRLFHTFKFKGNSVLLWKTWLRSCNKADTDMPITMDAKLGKLPGEKRLVPNREGPTANPPSPLPTACLTETQPADNTTANPVYTEQYNKEESPH